MISDDMDELFDFEDKEEENKDEETKSKTTKDDVNFQEDVAPPLFLFLASSFNVELVYIILKGIT